MKLVLNLYKYNSHIKKFNVTYSIKYLNCGIIYVYMYRFQVKLLVSMGNRLFPFSV